MIELGRQVLMFALVGMLNTAIGLAVIFGLMLGAGVGPVVSNMAGYGVGLCVSFTLNSHLTFRQGLSLASGLRFLLAFAISYGANLLCLLVLIGPLEVRAEYAQIGAMIVYTGVFFILSRLFVFKDDNRKAKPSEGVR